MKFDTYTPIAKLMEKVQYYGLGIYGYYPVAKQM